MAATFDTTRSRRFFYGDIPEMISLLEETSAFSVVAFFCLFCHRASHFQTKLGVPFMEFLWRSTVAKMVTRMTCGKRRSLRSRIPRFVSLALYQYLPVLAYHIAHTPPPFAAGSVQRIIYAFTELTRTGLVDLLCELTRP